MRLKEIERLRAMALLMVILGHMPIAVPKFLIHGYTGVSIFFVISGYVCSLSYENTRKLYADHSLRHTAVDFWVSRFFRVVPLVLIWIMLYFVCGHIVELYGGRYGDTYRFAQEIKWWLSGFYNYFFAYSRMSGLFGHLWTMAVEIQFYALLPLFFAAFRTRRSQNIACVVIIVASTVSRFFTPSDLIGKLTHTQLDSIFAGVMLYLNRDSLRLPKRIAALPGCVRALVSLILVAAIFLLPAWMDSTPLHAVKYMVFTVLAAALVYLAQLDAGWIMPDRYLSKLLEAIARVSFSTYVSHILMYSCIYYTFFTLWLALHWPWLASASRSARGLQIVFLIVLALLVGKFSQVFIEKPYAVYGKSVIAHYRKKHAA